MIVVQLFCGRHDVKSRSRAGWALLTALDFPPPHPAGDQEALSSSRPFSGSSFPRLTSGLQRQKLSPGPTTGGWRHWLLRQIATLPFRSPYAPFSAGVACLFSTRERSVGCFLLVLALLSRVAASSCPCAFCLEGMQDELLK